MINIKKLEKGKILWIVGSDNVPYSKVVVETFTYKSKNIIFFDEDDELEYEYSENENETYFETKEDCEIVCEKNILKKKNLLREIWEMENDLKNKIKEFNQMDWEDEGQYYTENEIDFIEKYHLSINYLKDYINSIFNLSPSFWKKANPFKFEKIEEIQKRKKEFLKNIGIEY